VAFTRNGRARGHTRRTHQHPLAPETCAPRADQGPPTAVARPKPSSRVCCIARLGHNAPQRAGGRRVPRCRVALIRPPARARRALAPPPLILRGSAPPHAAAASLSFFFFFFFFFFSSCASSSLSSSFSTALSDLMACDSHPVMRSLPLGMSSTVNL